MISDILYAILFLIMGILSLGVSSVFAAVEPFVAILVAYGGIWLLIIGCMFLKMEYYDKIRFNKKIPHLIHINISYIITIFFLLSGLFIVTTQSWETTDAINIDMSSDDLFRTFGVLCLIIGFANFIVIVADIIKKRKLTRG